MIISNDASNRKLNRIQVVPITSNTDRLYPCEAYVSLVGRTSNAMADQITTISKQRLRDKIDVFSLEEMEGVERAVRLQLALP